MQELFKKKRSDTYNCVDFVIDASKVLFQQDIGTVLESLTSSDSPPYPKYCTRRRFVKVHPTATEGIILFHNKPSSPHVGLLVEGRVLHLGQKGVQCVDKEILMVEFTSYSCYRSIA